MTDRLEVCLSAHTIPGRLLEQARRRPTAPAYHVRADGSWRATDWATYAGQVRSAARALIAHRIGAGDRVCILGFNRPEWTILDVAAMMIGAVPAGIYTTCSASEVAWIVEHAEARLLLVEDADTFARVGRSRDAMPVLEHVVLMHGAADGALSWAEFLAIGEAVPEAEVDAALAAVTPEQDATFIYTSGTTGPPKAVRLTHDNLVFTADVAQQITGMSHAARMISYLPLSHIAEQVFSIHGHLTIGYELFFAESMEKLREHFPEVRPTFLFGVPRVWEKMYAAFQVRLGAATGVRKHLAAWAMGVGRQSAAVRNRGEALSTWQALQHRLAERLLFKRVKGLIGLDALEFAVSGAAPINKEILEFFAGLDITIHEVYGQSEDTGPTSFNLPGKTRLGTVGLPLPGVQVQIAADGEILVRGRNVFAGYFKDPEATAAALEGGWLHSGDLGAFDDDGFLLITGRKKEILITSGGKNITPNLIEGALKNLPLVSQAVLIGDRRNYLTALITLDPEATKAFCAERGLPLDQAHKAPAVIQEIQRGIDEQVNPELARVEHIRKFTVLARELSIDEGELTPTMKVKRRVVLARFADAIEAMYAT